MDYEISITQIAMNREIIVKAIRLILFTASDMLLLQLLSSRTVYKPYFERTRKELEKELDQAASGWYCYFEHKVLML